MSQTDRMPTDYRVTRETTITRDNSGGTALVVVAIIVAAAIVIGLFYLVGHSSTTSPSAGIVAPNPAAPTALAPTDNSATAPATMAPAPTDNGATTSVPPASGTAAPPQGTSNLSGQPTQPPAQ